MIIQGHEVKVLRGRIGEFVGMKKLPRKYRDTERFIRNNLRQQEQEDF